jgi:adenine-specific DNA-methyltransferase
MAATLGWSIRINDSLASAVAMSHARLMSRRTARFATLGGYERAVSMLNRAKPVRGFVWKEYSPASARWVDTPRMYFTESNAARIDGIRQMIREWHDDGRLTDGEHRLVLADLLLATNRVANIAGTYGCFLSYWSPQSQADLTLTPRTLFQRGTDVKATISNVEDIQAAAADVVYLDPPYTKRQYAAYYHILETITVGDEPAVGGVTGLRPWREKASDFCYRTRALGALTRLIERQPAKRVLLSYSDQGHVPLGPLADALRRLGKVTVMPLKALGKYRPNRVAGDNGASVTEYLLTVLKPEARRSPNGLRVKAYA